MLRVLDWDLPGLGRNLAAVRQAGPAGEWTNIGWPGFVGCVTGLAPGRFAAAINQPPMPFSGLGRVGDWVCSRPAVWRSRALPPLHLLRQVFDTATDWQEAVAMLTHTPLSTRAFFVVVGVETDQACAIERLPDAAKVSYGSVAMANHWRSMPERGLPRGEDSETRQADMAAFVGGTDDPWSMEWLKAPILNRTTRVSAVLCPATGRIKVAGGEADGRATEWLETVG